MRPGTISDVRSEHLPHTPHLPDTPTPPHTHTQGGAFGPLSHLPKPSSAKPCQSHHRFVPLTVRGTSDPPRSRRRRSPLPFRNSVRGPASRSLEFSVALTLYGKRGRRECSVTAGSVILPPRIPKGFRPGETRGSLSSIIKSIPGQMVFSAVLKMKGLSVG